MPFADMGIQGHNLEAVPLLLRKEIFMAKRFEATIRSMKKYTTIQFDLLRYEVEFTAEGMKRMEKIDAAYTAKLKQAGISRGDVGFIRSSKSGAAFVLKEDAQQIKEQIDAVLNSPTCVRRVKPEPLE